DVECKSHWDRESFGRIRIQHIGCLNQGSRASLSDGTTTSKHAGISRLFLDSWGDRVCRRTPLVLYSQIQARQKRSSALVLKAANHDGMCDRYPGRRGQHLCRCGEPLCSQSGNPTADVERDKTETKAVSPMGFRSCRHGGRSDYRVVLVAPRETF